MLITQLIQSTPDSRQLSPTDNIDFSSSLISPDSPYLWRWIMIVNYLMIITIVITWYHNYHLIMIQHFLSVIPFLLLFFFIYCHASASCKVMEVGWTARPLEWAGRWKTVDHVTDIIYYIYLNYTMLYYIVLYMIY